MKIQLSNRQKRFFAIARSLALQSTYRFRLGAIIVRKKVIVGEGFNDPKRTHPASNNRWLTVHAELSAILDASKHVDDCDIYIYRADQNGRPALAKPCEYCYALLKSFNIKRIYYSDSSGYRVMR